MADWRVGQTVEGYFSTSVAGETFTTVFSAAPAGVTFVPTISHQGGGNYKLSFVATAAGTWHIRLLGNISGEDSEATWFVESGVVGPAAVIPAGSGLNSLAQLRRDVAMKVMDLHYGKATSNGSTSTFFDNLNFVETKGYFRGSEVVFVSGTAGNVGKVARVVDSSSDDFSLTLTPPLPLPTVTGDEIEIYNNKSHGFHLAQYRDAINLAIRSAGPAVGRVISQDIIATYEHDDGVIVVPEVFSHVGEVHIFNWDNRWEQVPPANESYGQGWYAQEGLGTIAIGNPHSYRIDERVVRLIGYADQATLSADTDVTSVDTEWLVATAASFLLASRGKADKMAIAGMYKNEADMVRGKLAARGRLPNAVRIR